MNFIHLPFPTGQVDADGRPTIEPVGASMRITLKSSKRIGWRHNVDRIAVYNGKCVYECVWEHADNGLPICIFALQIYDWKRLADTRLYPARGCVGFYAPVTGRPNTAACSTQLTFPVTNIDKLDAFAE